MPGNTILINGSIEYYVGDSKMDELIKYLNEHGTKQESEISTGKIEGAKVKEVKKDEEKPID